MECFAFSTSLFLVTTLEMGRLEAVTSFTDKEMKIQIRLVICLYPWCLGRWGGGTGTGSPGWLSCLGIPSLLHTASLKPAVPVTSK